MENLETVIAENIRLALAKTGGTQIALALAIGISKSKMSEVLAGTAYLSATELFRVANYFGVDTSWFAEERLPEVTTLAA